MELNTECPLCNSFDKKNNIITDFGKSFLHCNQCDLIFALKKDLPTVDEEFQRYQNHENSIDNDGYVEFLNRVIKPSVKYLDGKKTGLDYGCGPNPTLSILIVQMGFECDNYDPIFYPELPNKTYDFVYATECFEHFHHPRYDLKKISGLMNKGAILAVMTEFWKDISQFKSWYYTRDWTHVSFYHLDTFKYLCQEFGFELLETDSKRVILMKKK